MKDKRLKSDFLRFKYIDKYLKGSKILDIGSSEGNLHKLLTKANPCVSFFTLDNNKDADFNINLDAPHKIKKEFDTIIAGEIIEHLKSPIEFLNYCRKLLRSGGRLIITTPNATGLQYLINPGWCVNYKEYRGHSQAFTLDMLKRVLKEEGFKVIYSDYINAFWIKNPLEYVSLFIKRLRPDLIIVADKL